MTNLTKKGLYNLKKRYIKEGYKLALKENAMRKVFDYDDFSNSLAEAFCKTFINHSPDVELEKYVDGDLRDHVKQASKSYFEATQPQIEKVLKDLPNKILEIMQKGVDEEEQANLRKAEISKKWAARDAEIALKNQKKKDEFSKFMRGSSRF